MVFWKETKIKYASENYDIGRVYNVRCNKFKALSRTYKHLVAVKSDLKVICNKCNTALCDNIRTFSDFDYDLMIWGIILVVTTGVLLIIWKPFSKLGKQ
jgi:hypothetical protein